jgi:hypothetical protein
MRMLRAPVLSKMNGLSLERQGFVSGHQGIGGLHRAELARRGVHKTHGPVNPLPSSVYIIACELGRTVLSHFPGMCF